MTMSHDSDSLPTFWEDFTLMWDELGAEWQDSVSREFERRWMCKWESLFREYETLFEELGDFVNE